MRIPVPTNRLVAFTLAGALLTALVAGALAVPGIGTGPTAETTAGDTTAPQVAADAPTPNQEFTPAVETQSRYGEHEEYEEHEDEDEDEEHEEREEHEDEEHEEREEREDEEYEDEEEHEEYEEYDDGE